MTPDGAFRFSSVAHLESPVGRTATSLEMLKEGIESVGSDSIFHHVTRISIRYGRAGDLPANDFARWIGAALQDRETSEQLAFVGAQPLAPLETVRAALLGVLERVPARRRRAEVSEESAFHFVSSRSVRAPLGLEASGPGSVVDRWAELDLGSVFYHLIESRVLGPEEDVLASWLRDHDAEGLAKSAEELTATGRPLARLHRDIGARWRRKLIARRLVDRLDTPEEVRRTEARAAVVRLAGRLRSPHGEKSEP